MPAKAQKLGPGVLRLGPEATQLDISCQVTNAVLSPDKDTEDAVTVLCGDTIPGASTYNWKLSGTALVDVTSGGIVEWTWANKNKIAVFEFVPNSDAGASFAGSVVVDPLAVGGDSGKNMSQDFEWSCVGEPVPTFAPVTMGTFPSVTTFASTKTYPTPLDDSAGTTAAAAEPASGVEMTTDPGPVE